MGAVAGVGFGGEVMGLGLEVVGIVAGFRAWDFWVLGLGVWA